MSIRYTDSLPPIAYRQVQSIVHAFVGLQQCFQLQLKLSDTLSRLIERSEKQIDMKTIFISVNFIARRYSNFEKQIALKMSSKLFIILTWQ